MFHDEQPWNTISSLTCATYRLFGILLNQINSYSAQSVEGQVKWGMSCIPALHFGMVMWLEGSFQTNYRQSHKRLVESYAAGKNRKQFAAESPKSKIT